MTRIHNKNHIFYYVIFKSRYTTFFDKIILTHSNVICNRFFPKKAKNHSTSYFFYATIVTQWVTYHLPLTKYNPICNFYNQKSLIRLYQVITTFAKNPHKSLPRDYVRYGCDAQALPRAKKKGEERILCFSQITVHMKVSL